MLPPTPYLWLKLYMKRLAHEQRQEFPKVDFACAMQFIDICMLDVSNVNFLPSQIAASTLTRFFCSDGTFSPQLF